MKKKTPAIKEIEKDLDIYASLDVLADSEGGKLLISKLATDIISLAGTLGTKYKSSTHAELVGFCADLDSKYTMLLSLTRAKKNKDLATDALREELLRTPEEE